jgi:hypothetical protein
MAEFEKLDKLISLVNDSEGVSNLALRVDAYDELLQIREKIEGLQGKWTTFPDGRGLINEPRNRMELRKRDKMRAYLSDISPVPFKFGFTEKREDDDPFYHPISESNTEEFKKEVVFAQDATKSGHFLSPANTVWVIRSSVGWSKTKGSHFLGMLKYYLDTLGSEEAFVIREQGKVKNIRYDSMVAKRAFILIHAEWYEHVWFTSRSRVNEEIGYSITTLREVVNFLFQDPDANNKKLKDMLSIMRQSVYALSKTGRQIKWNAVDYTQRLNTLTGWQEQDMNEELTDQVYFDFSREEIIKSSNDMKDNGLISLNKLANALIDAPINDINNNAAMFMDAILALPGYTRTDPLLSQIKQADNISERKPDDTKAPFSEILTDRWREIGKYIIDEDLVLSWNDFLNIWPQILNNKGSGGDRVSLRVQLRDRGLSAGIRKLKGKRVGGKISIGGNFTSKIFVGYARPETVITEEAIRRKYTILDPGITGSRVVTAARLLRMVLPERTSRIAASEVFARGIQRYHIKNDDVNASFGTSNDFHVGQEVGIPDLDHAAGAVSSSDPKTLNILKDFSAFDASEMWWNTRRDAIEGLKEAFIQRSRTGAFGPFEGGIPELIDVIWGPGGGTDAWFLIGKRSDMVGNEDYILEEKRKGSKLIRFGSSALINLDMLRSGERVTLDYNNVSNYANFVYTLEQLRKLEEVKFNISLLRVRFMGDDEYEMWYIVNRDKWTVEVHDKVATISEESAQANGFKLNKFKTSIRIFYYEFLKKKWIHGIHFPLVHMQMFSAENVTIPVSPVQLIIGYGQTAAAYAWRAGAEVLCRRVLYHTWNIVRRIKMPVTFNKNQFFYLPFATIWTPISLGGVGHVPFTLYGASKDGAIILMLKKNLTWRKLVENAAHVLDVRITSKRRIVATILAKAGENIKKGMPTDAQLLDTDGNVISNDPLGKGIKAYQDIINRSGRMKSAFEAFNHAKDNRWPRAEEVYYGNAARNAARKAVESSSKLVELDLLSNKQIGNEFADRAADGRVKNIYAEAPWLKYVNYTFGEPLKVLHTMTMSPHAGSDEVKRNMIAYFGINGSKDAFKLTTDRFLQLLRRKDKRARRDLSADEILEYLSNERVSITQENIVKALIMMGFLESNARSVVSALDSLESLNAFINNAKVVSLGDIAFGTISTTLNDYNRVVDIEFPDLDPRAKRVLGQLGFMISVLTGNSNGNYRKVTISVTYTKLGLFFRDIYKGSRNWRPLILLDRSVATA